MHILYLNILNLLKEAFMAKDSTKIQLPEKKMPRHGIISQQNAKNF
jgi:hypothetical protein